MIAPAPTDVDVDLDAERRLRELARNGRETLQALDMSGFTGFREGVGILLADDGDTLTAMLAYFLAGSVLDGRTCAILRDVLDGASIVIATGPDELEAAAAKAADDMRARRGEA